MTWVGLKVEQHSIDALIGEGSFAWIYRGVSDSGEKMAFKVAKPSEFVLSGMGTGLICTRAFKFRTNGISEAVPDARELLNLEYEKMSSFQMPFLPTYYSKVIREGVGYLQMELLEGLTLADLIQARQGDPSAPDVSDVALKAIQDAALALHLLLGFGLPYHGDLTSDNIFLTKSTIKILDPGHFGELKLADRTVSGVCITTPEFYPLLKPDDLMALGLVAWHAMIGKPLIERESRELAGDDSNKVLSQELLRWLSTQENMGNFYLSALRSLSLPRERGITAAQEAVLLKGVRLALDHNGKVVRDTGYSTLRDFAQALEVFRT